jgi:hypothetical protein
MQWLPKVITGTPSLLLRLHTAMTILLHCRISTP